MKYFSGALLAASVSANINQGYGNASLGAQNGYGYGIGNNYLHGDMHGNVMQHQTSLQYGIQSAHSHITGYDSVQPVDSSDWTPAVATAQQTQKNLLYTDAAGAVAAAGFLVTLNSERKNYIIDRMLERETRLQDIHDDNLVKIQAPFTLQLDLLEEEIEDIAQAQAYAIADAGEAWTDLQNRMERYRFDREDAMMIETDRVFAILERAVQDSKDAADVLFAMRLDWLQGVYVSGDTAFFDSSVYDMAVFDNEFDLFTYDIGHGKGHGHTNQGAMGNQKTSNGFTKGEGIQGRDISKLRAAPGPVDGKTRRYDKMNLGGEDYARGVAEGERAGHFGYNQAAAMQVRAGPVRRRRGGKRAGKRGPAGYGRKPAGYSR